MTSKYVLTYYGALARAKTISQPEADPTPTRLSANQRREQLIQVAVDLFSRKGFNGTTTREIAVAAGVTEAIIFRHFETKEQLYKAIIDSKLNCADTAVWLADLQRAMDRDDDRAVFQGLIKAIITTHRTDPKFERLMLYAALEGNEIAMTYMQQVTASIVEVFRRYFARRQKEGRLRPIPSDLALAAIVGMAQHYALSKYVHGTKNRGLPDEQALESFTQIAMSGLGLKASKR